MYVNIIIPQIIAASPSATSATSASLQSGQPSPARPILHMKALNQLGEERRILSFPTPKHSQHILWWMFFTTSQVLVPCCSHQNAWNIPEVSTWCGNAAAIRSSTFHRCAWYLDAVAFVSSTSHKGGSRFTVFLVVNMEYVGLESGIWTRYKFSILK